jgi:phage baseplate assembly protein W
MARNTRTFADLDFSFMPSPISLVRNEGIGTLSYSTSSNIVTGTNTTFAKYDMTERNLIVNGVFIGKVKETVDSTHLILYTNAKSTASGQQFQYSNPADIVKRYDENAIKASVRNLILTSNFEKPFHPEIGTQINSLLFEPATPLLSAVLERTIQQTIDNFEPRVQLTRVNANVNPDNNSVNVTIYFTILNTKTPQTLNLLLQRTR